MPSATRKTKPNSGTAGSAPGKPKTVLKTSARHPQRRGEREHDAEDQQHRGEDRPQQQHQDQQDHHQDERDDEVAVVDRGVVGVDGGCRRLRRPGCGCRIRLGEARTQLAHGLLGRGESAASVQRRLQHHVDRRRPSGSPFTGAPGGRTRGCMPSVVTCRRAAGRVLRRSRSATSRRRRGRASCSAI